MADDGVGAPAGQAPADPRDTTTERERVRARARRSKEGSRSRDPRR